MWRADTIILLVTAGLALTASLALAYRAWWRRSRWCSRTPTGFGALLAPVMLMAAWLGATSSALFVSLAIITVATAVYWFDDLRELSARLRVTISLAVGVAIGGVFLFHAAQPMVVALPLALLAGVVTVAMVNTVNFLDGADLNIATFVILTAILMLAYAPTSTEWAPLAIGCLVFTLPFAIINRRPNTLYFGDSGSFAFAAVFTIMGAAFLFGPHMPPPEAAIPIALPVIDTAVVTAHRVRIRQRFTTRHYFHLYQRLQRCQPGFVYLLPQAINVALCLVAAQGLQAAGVGRTLSVAVAMAVVSLLFFLAARRWWVEGEPGPPPQRGLAI